MYVAITKRIVSF